jgi:hypothetical protein
MASHPVIDGYLAGLAGRLPSSTVDELADGLTEAWLQGQLAGLGPDDAARAAVTEFGEPDLVVDAFVAQSPGRRAARVLLATGPVAGASWAASLITTKAWTWPVPPFVALGLGLGLACVVATLAMAASSRHSYRRARLGGLGAMGVLTLDLVVPTAVLLATPTMAWPLAVGVLVCASRIGLVLRLLPPAIARR